VTLSARVRCLGSRLFFGVSNFHFGEIEIGLGRLGYDAPESELY
jgi:hypothetical protein